MSFCAAVTARRARAPQHRVHGSVPVRTIRPAARSASGFDLSHNLDSPVELHLYVFLQSELVDSTEMEDPRVLEEAASQIAR